VEDTSGGDFYRPRVPGSRERRPHFPAAALSQTAQELDGLGETLSVKLFVATPVPEAARNSGRARLWLGDAAANSRAGLVVGGPSGDDR
jgi:hypothetical protein